jgi:hypothetical protein
MRRLSGILLGGVLVLPLGAQPAFAQAAAQKFTIDGQAAVLMVSVNAARTAEYEKVLNKLKEVLAKSEAPEVRQQIAGWKVLKPLKPQPDGTIIYMHLITPVPGADYQILANIYQVVKAPEEQKALYDMYLSTGAKNVGLVTGSIALDFAR